MALDWKPIEHVSSPVLFMDYIDRVRERAFEIAGVPWEWLPGGRRGLPPIRRTEDPTP